MNDIGWLFLFMSDFQDKSISNARRSQLEPFAGSESLTDRLASLPIEEIAALREFFELIAKWDERASNRGN